mmetsp:Transcript_9569/g.19040  ORF Transcript_9569/g.19040 Transcript_9569/m.19040 type:complete len:462 (-) Transcript_9569:126-1511(-)
MMTCPAEGNPHQIHRPTKSNRNPPPFSTNRIHATNRTDRTTGPHDHDWIVSNIPRPPVWSATPNKDMGGYPDPPKINPHYTTPPPSSTTSPTATKSILRPKQYHGRMLCNHSERGGSYRLESRVSFSDFVSVTTFREARGGLQSASTSEFNFGCGFLPQSPVSVEEISQEKSCDEVSNSEREVGKDERNSSPYNLHLDEVLEIPQDKNNSLDKAKNNRRGESDGEKNGLSIDLDLEKVLKRTIENEKFVIVKDLPWQEKTPPFREGKYTGMVNRAISPHGKGVLILSSLRTRQDSMNIICGNWYKGIFITESWKENVFSQVIKKIEQIEERNEVDMQKSPKNKDPDRSTKICGRNYLLGDKLRSNDDIIHDEARNMVMISNLQVNDHAFIKRSDSSWTYALLTKRFHGSEPYREREKGSQNDFDSRGEEAETMTFSLDPLCHSKKTIERKKWAKCIRCALI